MKRYRKIPPLGASLIVFSSFFYASYGIWTKLLGDYMRGYTASAWRSALTLIILVPLGLAYKRLGSFDLRSNWRALVAMTLTSSLIWGPLFYAVLHAGVATSLAINFAATVIGMYFFGWLWAGEHFSRDKWSSAGIGIAGILLVFGPSFAGHGKLALLAAVLSGTAIAANSVMIKKLPYSPTQSAIALWGTSLLANLLMANLFRESQPQLVVSIHWLYLGAFAVASALASWTFIKGLQMIDVGTAGVLGLLEIVFGVIIGAVLFGERPSLPALVGIGLIIVAAALPYRLEMKKSSSALA